MPMLCKEVMKIHAHSCPKCTVMFLKHVKIQDNKDKKPLSLISLTKEPIPKYLTKHGSLLNY